MTVQIVPVLKAGETEEALSQRMTKDLDKALGILVETPGVISAKPLSREEIQKLLEPWFAGDSLAAEVVFPLLIDVVYDPEADLDMRLLERRLESDVPGIAVDDHRSWLVRLLAFARMVEFVAYGVVLCVSMAAAATVIFTTRSGLAVHRGIVEVMHLIGAKDSYIARQFQQHALRQGLAGGVPGFLLAMATVTALTGVASGVDIPLLPDISLSFWQWGLLLLLPVAAAVLTMLTARFTVLHALSKMP